ncbi:MAG: polysaccharide deacetylase family protein [Solirubrobacterales bacterium]
MRLASVCHIRKPNDLLILCHHGVSESWPTEFAIDPRRLEEQLRSLLRRGYRPMTLAAALAERPAGKTLVVTFDDAYRSVLLEGYPVLAGLGVPATVFVPTAYVSSQEPMAWSGMDGWLGTRFERELDCMTWEELRQLQANGWEIGSHTRNHRDLAALDDAEVAAELHGSREDCERELQRPCTSLAYPFSSYDQRVKDIARSAGYAAAVILDNRIAIPRRTMPFLPGVEPDPMELLRAGIYRGDGRARFQAKTSLAARRLRASKPVHLAQRLAPAGVGT